MYGFSYEESGDEAAVNEPKYMGGWQPIETAPKDGTEILLWYSWKLPNGACSGSHLIGAWIHPEDSSPNWYDADWNYLGDNPTHWMPLPDPPVTK